MRTLLRRLWEKLTKRYKGKLQYLKRNLHFRWSLQLLYKYPFVHTTGIPFSVAIKCDTASNQDNTPKASIHLVIANWRVIDFDIGNYYHGHHCPKSCCSR